MCGFTRAKDSNSVALFDIEGKALMINKEAEYSNIPERCPECQCVQSENWKDFSNQTIQVCGQCATEMNIAYC